MYNHILTISTPMNNPIIDQLYKDQIISSEERDDLYNISKNGTGLSQIQKLMNLLNSIQRDSKETLLEFYKTQVPHMFDYYTDRLQLTPLINDIFAAHQDYSPCQRLGVEQIINFLSSTSDVFAVYGYAGTGKTTLIIHVIKYLLEHKLLKYITLCAPTHKAVNVLKDKYDFLYGGIESYTDQEDNIGCVGTVRFSTIHKVLKYKKKILGNGITSFSADVIPIIENEFIVVDESSMLNHTMIYQLIGAIGKGTKILFVGDPAQLPPVENAMSLLFTNLDDAGQYGCVKRTFLRQGEPAESVDRLMEKVKAIRSITMETIVRNSNVTVMELFTYVRSWVLGKTRDLHLYKYRSAHVHILKHTSKWYEIFISIIRNNNSYILAWTNEAVKLHNKNVRTLLFNKEKLEKYEIGEFLVFNDYYKNMKTKVKFYTSDKVIVETIQRTQLSCPKSSIPLLLEKIHDDENKAVIVEVCGSPILLGLVEELNRAFPITFEVYELQVHRIPEVLINGETPKFTIHTLNPFFNKQINQMKTTSFNLIRSRMSDLCKENKSSEKIIYQLIAPIFWTYRDSVLFAPFAELSYGYSMTTHKSQASTFGTIFVDIDDIMKNSDDSNKKKCLYTAVTRSSCDVYFISK